MVQKFGFEITEVPHTVQKLLLFFRSVICFSKAFISFFDPPDFPFNPFPLMTKLMSPLSRHVFIHWKHSISISSTVLAKFFCFFPDFSTPGAISWDLLSPPFFSLVFFSSYRWISLLDWELKFGFEFPEEGPNKLGIKGKLVLSSFQIYQPPRPVYTPHCSIVRTTPILTKCAFIN